MGGHRGLEVWGLCCSRLSQGGKPLGGSWGSVSFPVIPVCLSDCKLIPSCFMPQSKQDWAHGCAHARLWHIRPDAQDSWVGKTIKRW